MNWKDPFAKELTEKEQNGGFRRGELKAFIENCAEKYNISKNTLMMYYYQTYKKKEINENHIDEEATNPNMEPIEYKVGDIVNVTTTGSQPYGIFAITDDNTKMLIHIKAMSPEQIAIMDELKIGATLKARIIHIEDDGKLAGSIKEFPVIKKGITINDANREIEEIVDNLLKAVDEVSEKAKEKIKENIARYGIVKFVLAMAHVVPTFQYDPSLALVHEIENELSDYL